MNLSKRQIEIIEVAGKLITYGGVSELTTKNLAKEMNFTEPALYRHFKNKEEIIIGMLKHLGADMDERLSETFLLSNDPIEQLQNLFQEQFRFFNENQHFLVAVFSNGIWENNQKIQSAIQGVMSIKKKHLSKIVSKGIEENKFTSSISEESLIHISMGSFRLHLLKWKMSNFSFDLISTGEKLINDLLILFKNK